MSCSTIVDICENPSCGSQYPNFCSFPDIPVPCEVCGRLLDDAYELNDETSKELVASKDQIEINWYLVLCIVIVMVAFVAIIYTCRRRTHGFYSFDNMVKLKDSKKKQNSKYNDIESQVNYDTFTHVESN